MMSTPEEIFADLISFRKEINAPEVPVNWETKPFRFALYNPAGDNPRFHIMPCTVIRAAQGDGTIGNLRRTSSYSGLFTMYGSLPQRLKVCSHCVKEWNKKFPGTQLDANTFDIAKFFLCGEYYPDIWDTIDIPPEIDEGECMSGCFLLYRPVKNSPFHFMKCSMGQRKRLEERL